MALPVEKDPTLQQSLVKIRIDCCGHWRKQYLRPREKEGYASQLPGRAGNVLAHC